MPRTVDLAVDFMDMTNDRRLLTRVIDARAGYTPIAGRHAIAGDHGADPKVARIMSIDVDGIIDLEVLPGPSTPIVTCSLLPEAGAVEGWRRPPLATALSASTPEPCLTEPSRPTERWPWSVQRR